MKRKDLIKIISFPVGFLLVALGIHSILVAGLRQYHTGGFDVFNQIVSGKAEAETLILGTSRALVHFNCEIIKGETKASCYVIGWDGSKIEMHSPLLQTYLLNNPKPKTLIQVLGPNEMMAEEIPHPYQFISHLNQRPLYEFALKKDKRFLLHKFVPLYSFVVFKKELINSAIRGLLHETDYEEPFWARRKRILGYLPVDLKWTNEFDYFKRQYPNGMVLNATEQSVSALRSIAKLCQQQGIRLIFVYPPVYYESLQYFRDMDKIYGIYQQIASEFNVPIYDYRNIPITREKKFFYNSQHLNRMGAAVFSEIFAEDLIRNLSM